jgi:hypothetical protein
MVLCNNWQWGVSIACQTQLLRLQFVAAIYSSLNKENKNFPKPFIQLLAEFYIYAKNVTYNNKYA